LEDSFRVERVLATARLIVAMSFAASANIGDRLDLNVTSDLLLLGYGLFAACTLVLIRIRQRMTGKLALTLHAIDIVWASAGIMADQSVASPFFAFYIFAVLAAAYRWGYRETLATATVGVIVLAIEARLIMAAAPERLADLATVLRRIAYILMTGVLGGYLAEEDRLLRFETAVQTAMIAKVKSERGFFGSLQAVAEDALRIFSAREFVIALTDLAAGRFFLLFASIDGANGELRFKTIELPFERRLLYFFDAPEAWAALRRRFTLRRDALTLLALDDVERKVRPEFTMPKDFRTAHPFQVVLGVSFQFDADWVGRLFLIDPPRGAAREKPLRFLQQLTGQVGPAVHAVYLIRRLRTRAGAIERARVARELHDGVIQSLIGVEMRLDVLKRQTISSSTNGSIERELGQLEELVREEVLNLRDLMQQMKPRDLSPKQLLDYLIDLVERFRHDTGISARFITDLQEVPLPQQARRELARILQEALVNVRKHSGARNVLVRLERSNGAFRLVVDDDGRGYGFEGRYNQTELDASRRGPVVIKERVRSIGGEVTIESVMGKGSRLEITVPHRAPQQVG
jgi:signal transduction histidine kinase